MRSQVRVDSKREGDAQQPPFGDVSKVFYMIIMTFHSQNCEPCTTPNSINREYNCLSSDYVIKPGPIHMESLREQPYRRGLKQVSKVYLGVQDAPGSILGGVWK